MNELKKEDRMDRGDKKEILERVQGKKVHIGEMEHKNIGKSNWIAVVVAAVLTGIFMVVEGFLGHYTSVHALAAVCYAWASVFYFCQYFIAKRPWQVLIGAVLEAIGSIIMITLFILRVTGVMG